MAISSLSLGVFTVTLIIVPSEASGLLLLLLPGSAAPWSAIFTPPMEQLGSGVSFRVIRGQTSFQNESPESPCSWSARLVRSNTKLLKKKNYVFWWLFSIVSERPCLVEVVGTLLLHPTQQCWSSSWVAYCQKLMTFKWLNYWWLKNVINTLNSWWQ